MNSIKTENLSISYGDFDIVKNLNLNIPKGKITTIIGSNGCGKSTILKTIARILKPKSGVIYINDNDIQDLSSNFISKEMAVLPQSPQAPNGLTVGELVAYGRFPHQSGFGKLTSQDKEKIDWSLKIIGMQEFKDRPIETLSGGQRQRVWIAMALAQETEILLLDEPTTYLDLAHQLEILQLLESLNKTQGQTIVMVIHDLNNAARFADYMVGIKDGNIVCTGSPKEIMTKDNLRKIFNIDAVVINEPLNNKPVCITYNLI
ncbi:ABC transporter ATP-binding protein [Clostridium sp. CM028]|uniref:ABC transporter ATP-binding protein n=1 Tax=unclassified Clostridium TaxID=2614128 RepID=UPI001C6E99D6|nr:MULTISPECIES: ABC transporter ATP-binding protein [unclassified Clostridium]MBW9145566.1 ABC transporter ATP-binding protein [Clostridium sp. CM027]MBW9148930.1 ABC transporter ATP-binding protein [Clostridium sp. CM028]UVE42397.1 ABC transporter ATP-binding protein [Clostridium sp. CM027]WLC62969.1 ABC transporter ATP-binding protein [Clostridium sp. CM028]